MTARGAGDAEGEVVSAHQPAFDFNAAPARRTDPVSSQIAADANAGLRRKDRWKVLELHYQYRDTGLDDFQLAEMTGRGQTSIGKRRGELADARHFDPPLIENTGQRRVSPSGLTNSVVCVWRITAAGIEAYLKGTK